MKHIGRCCLIYILYIFLGLLVIGYFYILLSNRKKTSISFGRKKKLIEIINKYHNITPRANRKIENAVHEMGELFYKNGEIDYEKLLDTLAKIKQKKDGEKIIYIIDIFIEGIRTSNPYLHISNASAKLFKQLDDDIKRENYKNAFSDLKLLYEKSIEVEKLLKQRGKAEFWIGTAIGILGIMISCVTGLFI